MDFVLGALSYLGWSIGLYRAMAKEANGTATTTTTTTNEALRDELKLLQRAVI